MVAQELTTAAALIMAGPDYFFCERLRCRMRRANCLSRRKSQERAAADGRTWQAGPGGATIDCLGCGQGDRIAAEEGRNKAAASGKIEDRREMRAKEEGKMAREKGERKTRIQAACGNCGRTRQIQARGLCGGCYEAVRELIKKFGEDSAEVRAALAEARNRLFWVGPASTGGKPLEGAAEKHVPDPRRVIDRIAGRRKKRGTAEAPPEGETKTLCPGEDQRDNGVAERDRRAGTDRREEEAAMYLHIDRRRGGERRADWRKPNSRAPRAGDGATGTMKPGPEESPLGRAQQSPLGRPQQSPYDRFVRAVDQVEKLIARLLAYEAQQPKGNAAGPEKAEPELKLDVRPAEKDKGEAPPDRKPGKYEEGWDSGRLPNRPSWWSVIDADEKCLRLRGQIKSLQREMGEMRESLALLMIHDHSGTGQGELRAPLHSLRTSGLLSGSAKIAQEAGPGKDDVYF